MTKVDEFKLELQKYIDSGKNLQELSQKDEIYRKIRNWDLFVDGKRVSLEDKFKILGFSRDKIRLDENDIKTLIDIYLINGGEINVPIKSLPFYEQIHAIVKTKHNNGNKNYTFFDALSELGYPQFSGVNNTYEILLKLETFKDADGNVDSYRQDKTLRSAICALSETTQIPESLIITLVANQKLKTVYVKTDRIEFLKQQLIEFAANNNDSLVGIKSKNLRLYDLFSSCKNHYSTEHGKKISSKEFLQILGLDYLDECLKSETKDYDPQNFIKQLIEFAQKNGNKISNEQFRQLPEFSAFYSYLRRNNLNLQTFLAKYNITYLNSQVHESDTLVATNKYPYFDEMDSLKNKLFENFKTKNPNLSKQAIMKKYIEICQNVYEKYKDKIYSDPLNQKEKY